MLLNLKTILKRPYQLAFITGADGHALRVCLPDDQGAHNVHAVPYQPDLEYHLGKQGDRTVSLRISKPKEGDEVKHPLPSKAKSGKPTKETRTQTDYRSYLFEMTEPEHADSMIRLLRRCLTTGPTPAGSLAGRIGNGIWLTMRILMGALAILFMWMLLMLIVQVGEQLVDETPDIGSQGSLIPDQRPAPGEPGEEEDVALSGMPTDQTELAYKVIEQQQLLAAYEEEMRRLSQIQQFAPTPQEVAVAAMERGQHRPGELSGSRSQPPGDQPDPAAPVAIGAMSDAQYKGLLNRLERVVVDEQDRGNTCDGLKSLAEFVRREQSGMARGG